MNSVSFDPVARDLQFALSAYQRGNLDEAERKVSALSLANPSHPGVLMAQGVIANGRGKQEQALSYIQKSLKLLPNNPEALGWALHLTTQLGKLVQAEEYARAWTGVDGNNPKPFYALALNLRSQSKTREAITAIDQCLAIQPSNPEALVLKARLLRDWNLPGLAMEIYFQATSAGPNPHAAIDLAQIYLRDNQPQAAIDAIEQGFPAGAAHRPHDLIARAYTGLRRFDEAQPEWDLAIATNKDPGTLTYHRALAETAAGRFDVAEALLLRSLDAGESLGSNFYLLGIGKKFSQADSELIERVDQESRKPGVSAQEAIYFQYGLGKAYDDLGEYDLAIQRFDAANRLRQANHKVRGGWSGEGLKRSIDLQIEFFTKDRVASALEGDPSELPLFIVGMVRSGTTLAESILAAHSKVEAGGERGFWSGRTLELNDYESRSVNVDLARQFGSEYLNLIQPMDENRVRSTDKNPSNFYLSALLHSVFPGARIVHMKRNPLDNLLSMWFNHFAAREQFPATREDLVVMYREYLRLLLHLEEVLPSHSFKTFKYEELTSKPETVIPELLEFSGLEFEESCLQPHRQDRSVLTPSVAQVRQPISTRSQNRWKKYEAYLGAFSELG